jgi:hypothetical protein
MEKNININNLFTIRCNEENDHLKISDIKKVELRNDIAKDVISIILDLDEIIILTGSQHRAINIKCTDKFNSYTNSKINLKIKSSGKYNSTNEELITNILTDGFKDCLKLESLDLSECNNFHTISGNAFTGCINLTSVNFPKVPKVLKTIETDAFRRCGLTSVDLSNTDVPCIQSNVFSDCPNLISVNLSGCASLREILAQAFYNCPLETINLSGCTTLATIGEEAFGQSSFNTTIGELKSLNLSGCTALSNIGGGVEERERSEGIFGKAFPNFKYHFLWDGEDQSLIQQKQQLSQQKQQLSQEKKELSQENEELSQENEELISDIKKKNNQLIGVTTIAAITTISAIWLYIKK